MPQISIQDPFLNNKMVKLLDQVTVLVEQLDKLQFNHALALQRIAALEDKISEPVVVQSSEQQREDIILQYFETHDGISTNATMKLLNLSHHSSAHRLMKHCADTYDFLQLSKTSTGKLVLKIDRRLNQ